MATDRAVIEALTPFGISGIGFIPIPETDFTAIRITDQPYHGRNGHETIQMIARDIIEPLGLDISGIVSGGARFTGDDEIGAAIIVRDLLLTGDSQ